MAMYGVGWFLPVPDGRGRFWTNLWIVLSYAGLNSMLFDGSGLFGNVMVDSLSPYGLFFGLYFQLDGG